MLSCCEEGENRGEVQRNSGRKLGAGERNFREAVSGFQSPVCKAFLVRCPLNTRWGAENPGCRKWL